MTSRSRLVSIAWSCVLGVAVWPALGQDPGQGPAASPAAPPPADPAVFARQVDLGELGRIAVHAEGRLKSFDSFASSMMRYVSGPRRVDGQSPTFTYLDLMLRTHRYHDADIIFVKKKPMRAQIIQTLERTAAADAPGFQARMDRFLDTGLVSETLLRIPEVRDLLAKLNTDLIRTAKFVEMIETALAVKEPRVLLGSWRIVPPPGGGFETPWLSLEEMMTSETTAIAPEVSRRVQTIWERFVNAWLTEDPAGVNAAAGELAAVLPTVDPELYPSQSRLKWESFYFRARNLTWIWLFYALSLIPLLINLIFRWPFARWLGIGLFLLAFALQTGALLLRWYVADRWPNSNMFEAVTTAAWFGGCAAVVLEILVRHTRMRNIFALGSAVASMVALMCAHYLPLYLDAGIENRMPVLHDVWLYIHTNVIIFSYCLIFMAAVTALLYLLRRGWQWGRGEPGARDFARVGGAATLILAEADGGTSTTPVGGSLGAVLDGTTMVLMELSFIMLWAGLVMGAIWADHSWGRPWGWDPKEVFALNTFLVFAILVHVRLKTRDKGLWTALIALVGAGVMLFNWIAVNFVITGLHSYA